MERRARFGDEDRAAHQGQVGRGVFPSVGAYTVDDPFGQLERLQRILAIDARLRSLKHRLNKFLELDS